jgi:hypothetical protein
VPRLREERLVLIVNVMPSLNASYIDVKRHLVFIRLQQVNSLPASVLFVACVPVQLDRRLQFGSKTYRDRV